MSDQGRAGTGTGAACHVIQNRREQNMGKDVLHTRKLQIKTGSTKHDHRQTQRVTKHNYEQMQQIQVKQKYIYTTCQRLVMRQNEKKCYTGLKQDIF